MSTAQSRRLLESQSGGATPWRRLERLARLESTQRAGGYEVVEFSPRKAAETDRVPEGTAGRHRPCNGHRA